MSRTQPGSPPPTTTPPDDLLQMRRGGGSISYHLANDLNSTRQLVDGGGNVTYAFDAFGQLLGTLSPPARIPSSLTGSSGTRPQESTNCEPGNTSRNRPLP